MFSKRSKREKDPNDPQYFPLVALLITRASIIMSVLAGIALIVGCIALLSGGE